MFTKTLAKIVIKGLVFHDKKEMRTVTTEKKTVLKCITMFFKKKIITISTTMTLI